MSKLKILWIIVGVVLLMLVFKIAFEGSPNQSNATIEAIHGDTTQRNVLQKETNELHAETNELLGDIKTLLEEKEFVIEFISE